MGIHDAALSRNFLPGLFANVALPMFWLARVMPKVHLSPITDMVLQCDKCGEVPLGDQRHCSNSFLPLR